jgi:pSer/pThr/pTyr-binding forkhead associated (FHA) protein
MPQQQKPGQSRTHPEPTETSGDLDDKIIKALASGAKGPVPKSSTDPTRTAVAEPLGVRPALPFRPMARPPIAMLTMCDDGKNEGAVFRIVTHRFVIGRTEGDLRIEIDGRISARHVEITLQTIAGRHHRWVLTDLQSTHGLFVRVTRTLLADQSEFLVGGGRYRFEAPRYEGESTESATTVRELGRTDTWHSNTAAAQPPALTELVGDGIGNRVVLLKPEYWIGSDPACPICRPEDPFCEPYHARIYRNPKGSWYAENNKTHNGLWMRMSQVAVESVVHFQIGEQRFRLRAR